MAICRCQWLRGPDKSIVLGYSAEGRFLMTYHSYDSMGWYCCGLQFTSSGFWLGVSQLKPFIYTSPAVNLAIPNKQREVDLLQSWSDLNPPPLVGISIIYTLVTQSRVSKQIEVRGFVKARTHGKPRQHWEANSHSLDLNFVLWLTELRWPPCCACPVPVRSPAAKIVE